MKMRTKQILKYVLMLNTLPLKPMKKYSEIKATLHDGSYLKVEYQNKLIA